MKHEILPVNEDLELPEGTVAPLAVIEPFINEASDHLTLNRCPCCCISTCMPLASREARDLLVKLEGVSVEITEECNGCGRCVPPHLTASDIDPAV